MREAFTRVAHSLLMVETGLFSRVDHLAFPTYVAYIHHGLTRACKVSSRYEGFEVRQVLAVLSVASDNTALILQTFHARGFLLFEQ